jgi:hypothetical protein
MLSVNFDNLKYDYSFCLYHLFDPTRSRILSREEKNGSYCVFQVIGQHLQVIEKIFLDNWENTLLTYCPLFLLSLLKRVLNVIFIFNRTMSYTKSIYIRGNFFFYKVVS